MHSKIRLMHKELTERSCFFKNSSIHTQQNSKRSFVRPIREIYTFYSSLWTLTCTHSSAKICQVTSINVTSSIRQPKPYTICIQLNLYTEISNHLMCSLIKIVLLKFAILDSLGQQKMKSNSLLFLLTISPPDGTEHLRFCSARKSTRKRQMCGVLGV